MRSGGGRVSAAWGVARLLFFVSILLAFASFTRGLSSPSTAHALDGEEASFLTLINNYRAQNGLAPLTLSDQLNVVARWMANDMAANNYFSHTDSLGRDPFVRMDQLGYNYNTGAARILSPERPAPRQHSTCGRALPVTTRTC
jgi:uncharacterized protein YkwD